MKKLLCALVTGAAFIAPFIASAEAVSELHIGSDQTFTGKSLYIMDKRGSNIFARARWGLTYVRVTILANKDTIITRAHGEAATIDDVSVEDLIDVSGTLLGGEGVMTIRPTTIRDAALEVAGKNMSGKISALNTDLHSFTLAAPQGTVNVTINSTTTVTKGARSISFSELSVGDKVLKVAGAYDYTKNSLAADSMDIFQVQTLFIPRNFVGTTTAIDASASTITMLSEGKTFTVDVSKASFLNSSKKTVTLSRFSTGDAVRVFGAIDKTDISHIIAEVVRDMDF